MGSPQVDYIEAGNVAQRIELALAETGAPPQPILDVVEL